MHCDESDEFSASDANHENNEASKNENNENIEISTDQMFLTASELYAIRENLFKSKNKEDLELYKGHKFYYSSECPAAEEIIEDIMTDNKKSLKLERIAKNKDCLKAEWNEKDKIAVVPYLKGKTTQHMGITMNGKCVLSPEEALFLLDKGVIEVEYNKMPLSIEEAYSVMLKGKLAVEKYEVYTHLSQQGFIVVNHQSRTGLHYLKVMNLSKRKKRKRKATKSTELPEQKRLTFSGVFPSNSKSVNNENNLFNESLLSNDASLSNDKIISSVNFEENQDIENKKVDLELPNNVISNDASISSDKIISSVNFKENQDIDNKKMDLELPNNVISNDASISSDKIISSAIFKDNEDIANEKMDLELQNVISSNVNAVDSQVDREATSNNDVMCSNFKSQTSLEKETNMPCFKDQIAQNDYVKELDISAKNNESLDNSNTCMADEMDITDQTINDKVSETNNNEIKITGVSADVKRINVANVNENVIDINKIDVENVNKENDQNENIIDIETASNNEIDFEDINKENVGNVINGDTNEIIIEENEKGEINVEDSDSVYDDDEYESTDESSVVCDESEDESLDVYSYSPSDQQNDKDIIIDTNNVVYKPSEIQDEEVTLVKVKKLEKKPLAVIDLFSDEDIDTVEKSEGNGKTTFEDSNEEIEFLEEFPGIDNRDSSHRNANLIKQDSSKMKAEVSEVKMQSEIKFPDAFKKDIICVSRPPIYLLPVHCIPSKEVYIINSEISSESRSNPQRPKRLWNSYRDMQNYQRERRSEKQRNSFAHRSPGLFREQNEQFSAFNPPEYMRDVGNDRNYDFSSLPCKNVYQPVTSERGLLPTPGSFSSSNHLSFPINVHNLQSLSSTNPTAFANEIQKTVYSVASNMISTILNQHLNPINSHPAYPTPFNNSSFMNFSMPHTVMPNFISHNSDRNNYNPMRLSDPSFSGERNSFSMNESPFMIENNRRQGNNFENNWRQGNNFENDWRQGNNFENDWRQGNNFENDWRQGNNFRQKKFTPRGPPFPCKYRAIRRKRDWNDIKAAVERADLSNSGSDIEEVPINLNRFLYSNDIKPLIDPGIKLPVADGLKALKITQISNLSDMQKNIDRYLPTTLSLEISFDVYLPNTNYRRSEPSVPNYRIIVVRASDQIPRYSELVNLQRKWNDGAILQIAVVDHGDISFYSFNNVNIQELVPFDLLHQ